MQTLQLQLPPEYQSDITFIKLQLEELKKNFEPKTPTEYLSRGETATLLKADLSSIHNWTKRKLLQSYGISGRVYYKRSEIENAIVKLIK